MSSSQKPKFKKRKRNSFTPAPGIGMASPNDGGMGAASGFNMANYNPMSIVNAFKNADYSKIGYGKAGTLDPKKEQELIEESHKYSVERFEDTSARFESMLSGYVEASNQMGIVSALIMGTCVGLLASLIGHWWDNVDSGVSRWKIETFVALSIVDIYLSLAAVVWSFAYSNKYTLVMHAWASEACDVRWTYTNYLRDRRDLELEFKCKMTSSLVEEHDAETSLLYVLTQLTTFVFPFTCMFAALVSMSENDIERGAVEHFERMDGEHIDPFETVMISMMALFTLGYMVLSITGCWKLNQSRGKVKGVRTLKSWADVLDQLVLQMYWDVKDNIAKLHGETPTKSKHRSDINFACDATRNENVRQANSGDRLYRKASGETKVAAETTSNRYVAGALSGSQQQAMAATNTPRRTRRQIKARRQRKSNFIRHNNGGAQKSQNGGAQNDGVQNSQYGGEQKSQNGGEQKSQNGGEQKSQNGGEQNSQNGVVQNSQNGDAQNSQNGDAQNSQNGGEQKYQSESTTERLLF